MLIKRLLGLLAAILGFVGVLVGVAGVPATVSLGSRVNRANDRAFTLVDGALVAAQDRVLTAKSYVHASRITAADFKQAVKECASRQISQEIVSRLQIEDRAEKLSLTLQQAGTCLDTSATLVRGVQQSLELASSLGIPADATVVEAVPEKLLELKGRLQQATETVDRIRESVAAVTIEEPPEDRLARAIQLAAGVVATLGEIDTRLEGLADWLAQKRVAMEQQRARMHTYIVIAVILVLLLFAWWAAGQVALCVYGWRCRCNARACDRLRRLGGMCRRKDFANPT